MHAVTAFTSVLLLVLSHAAAAQSTLDADSKELQAYRLTMTTLNQFVAATKELAAAIKNDPRYAEVMKLEAEQKRLRDKEELTDAEAERLEKLDAEIEAAKEKMPRSRLNMSDSANQSLSDMEAAIKSEPVMANALRKAGLAPRDYVKFALAFFQASMIQGMQKSGMVKQIPPELQKSVNMDNIKFVADNEKEIARIMEELQALSKQ